MASVAVITVNKAKKKKPGLEIVIASRATAAVTPAAVALLLLGPRYPSLVLVGLRWLSLACMGRARMVVVRVDSLY